jgi:SAM-dependent methyltransferase
MSQISLERRACPICGTRQDSRLYASGNFRWEELDRFAFASRKLPEYMHWPLSQCGRCDLVYAEEAPAPEALASLYCDADFGSSRESRLATATYARLLDRFLHRLPDRSRAADIGTGDGAFLLELLARKFEDVEGIEPSAAPIELADASIRHLIRHDIFRHDSFTPESMSLITCFQTIEHLPAPLAFCRQAWQALKPGGVLFLIGHNRRAFSAVVLGRKSPIFDIEHLQLFSPGSFFCLLRAAGFSRVETFPVLNRYPLAYWAKLFPFPRAVKRPLLGMLESSPLGRRVFPLPAGNLAAIAFK